MNAVAAIPELEPNDRVFRLIKPQAAFMRSNARFPAYVASWGTGKSLTLIGKGMALSNEFPNNLGIVFRKEFTDLRDSTIKDFEDYTGLRVNSSREVTLDNGSTIMFRHIEELNNIQNINLGWFGIEQAEELETDDQFFTLFGRLRRKGVRHCGFAVANTNGHNWMWRLWKQGALADVVKDLMQAKPDLFPGATRPEDIVQLFEARTNDNAHNLDKGFLASLELMKAEKPRLYNRFVDNSWEDADTVDTVIPSEWTTLATQRTDAADGQVILGVDVARFGDDKTVILPIKGRRMLPYKTLEDKDTMEVADEVALMADDLDAAGIYVDVIGIGAGVYDRLKQLDYNVFPVNTAEKSLVLDKKTKKPKFKNLRSEVWWRARQSLDPNKITNPSPFSIIPDRKLEEDLTAPKYTIKAGQIVVEEKAEMKKRLKRSPDFADAYCLAVYGIVVGDKTKPAAALIGGMPTSEAGPERGLRRRDWMQP